MTRLSSWIAAVYRFTATRGSAFQVLSKATASGCLALWFAPTGHKLQTGIGNRGGGNLGHTTCMPPDSFFQAWVSVGDATSICSLSACNQILASLVVCSCSMEFQGMSGWRQHLQSLVVLSAWHVRRLAVQVCHTGNRQTVGCLVSIATNSVDEEWLVLEDFPALLLPMTTEGWGWITAC